ncbi:metallophosphoesterase [Thalassoroseus pseudoceratinae]|uniref:metallophosphoesterase n=1 Tax=Thalassoroseus pseudoceratinae TaxID=2713176 RepID=UPI0014224B1A|nr:metallophosphoesterase [Thalassoroseus pseudoceratinae]
MRLLLTLILLPLAQETVAAGEITRIWLTHRSNDPSKIVVNWLSDQAGDSTVRFGLSKEYGESVRIRENSTLHHVEIPLQYRNAIYHYSVSTGNQHSTDASFKAYPTDVLRVAVVADWQGKPDLSAIDADDVHLLLTAGDNIARLWDKCGDGTKNCILPYVELIDTYPELFRSTPMMPVLGNHDREIRPRGNKPPAEPVYDVDATAFRRFFELPGDEWKWHFDLPEFDLRLVALDFNHTSDFGTTWQTCHAFDEESEQFRWYQALMQKPLGFVVTLYNEQNASIRRRAGGQWHELFRRGTACITGFGYYAERAEADRFPYYNTALNGRGNQYPDPQSKFLAGEDSYVLLTVKHDGPMTVEIKNLKGTVLDRQEFERGQKSALR